ncbi:hypothetical protein [Candidatus Laterigemmans baculatus]|uniref:hypothetical protein n=1 Tax=Candidatus Laterigemmans baculatus TaxID=2770505 RepID=UPI00193C5B34|nr:hypothetical protein [Candidatus Laterigemmans baculatus]
MLRITPIRLVLGTLWALTLAAGPASADSPAFVAGKPYRVGAAEAELNSATTEIVADERLAGEQGITLQADAEAAVDGDRSEPDVSFRIDAPEAGTYVVSSYAVVDDEGAALMKKARGKYDSLFMKLQFDDGRPTKRVVYVPWNRPRQETGKFELSGKPQQLKIWLPRGVRLGYVEFRSYTPPAVPEKAQNYEPEFVPPATRPRLWVNQDSLRIVKERLTVGENAEVWERLTEAAKKPFEFEFSPEKEVPFNAPLEKAAETKAFYYLMTGDKAVGREAVELSVDYLSHVEFGNVLDITREIGRAIYTASLVYDWCHDLLSEEERQILQTHLMRLAADMECGWPPFKQSVVNGHGNEAQIQRDLLAMSIALYGDDSQPYQYTSYIILEDLVPMRAFEYQSPRHNQGVNYGAYRFGWEMHAAWFFYRMTGEPAFDENIKGVRKFWQYMRLPDGQMLRDGDGFGAGRPGEFYYWKHPQTMLLMYAYAEDPVLKADFERQGGLASNPVLFLLLNDPNLKPVESRESLPLTIDFGPILGSMIARTGWDIGLDSNDVVAEIKGGGYHFGNHQHSDAGALQIYYRGLQVADLGVYKFYGTPYDHNFNKRSIAHSMMLARDPDEKFLSTESNDGGTRYNQSHPRTPEQTKRDPRFHNGKVISSDFGPSKLKPAYSYFKADLTSAYSDKIDQYTRGFCFLNLGREDVPAAIILTDDMATANPEFQKYWQINTLEPPQQTRDGVILRNQRGELVGKTHVAMLVPTSADRQLEILSGEKANSSFEFQYEAPPTSHPEASGHRIMISPKTAQKRDRFLTVFQMAAGDTEPLEVDFQETVESYVVSLADRVVSLNKNSEPIQKRFSFQVPDGGERQVLLAGLEPGTWKVRSQDGQVDFEAKVTAGRNTLFFEANSGEFVISPQ